MEVIIVFLHLLQSYRFHKINEIIYKTFLTVPQKKAIDANTNIPEVIQEFSGSLNQRKTTLNLSIMVCLDIFLMTLFGILKSDHC
jgi:hypothetical protein